MLFSKEELENFKNHICENNPNLSENELKKITRNEFVGWLDDLKDELRIIIKADSMLDPAQKDERVKKSRNDYLFFAKTYFPHYFLIEGECILHKELSKLFLKMFSKNKGDKYALAAPRGHAKTTHAAKILAIWVICFELRKFIIEISDAVELVEGNLEAIKVELEDNPRLKADFPQVCGMSKNWKVGEFITNNGIKIKAFGSGKRLRGVTYGPYRPDLVIIDDLENDTNVRSKEQRDKLEDWLDEAVLNLGGVDGKMIVLYIGTILHQDSVLARKLKLSYWNPRKFSSIISFPKRMDLWDEYSKIYKSQGFEECDRFYKTNKKLMDEGARVLWKEALPIDALMRKRAENLRAFNKEQMNEPLSENQKFTREKFHFTKYLPRLDYKVMWVDPAGNGKKSDFTAIAVMGVNKSLRKCYLIEHVMKVMSSNEIIDSVLQLQMRHNCKICGFETNGGQFHLKRWLQEKAFDRNIYLPIKGIHNSKNKQERIESLEIPIEEGEIEFYGDYELLISQFIEFPEGSHDDGPDSVEGAYSLIKMKKTHKSKNKVKINFGIRNKLWQPMI